MSNPIELGGFSKELLENPAFKAAIALLREKLFEEIASSAPHDTETRDRCYWMVRMIPEFTSQLASIANDGEALRDRAARDARRAR